ncbi:hypothetical protein B1756_00015 [Natrarchaeobaculum aegyptiacum]|uniref:Uncharacterized protein n=1 Tax=Natrarchaeobaculum aegyptiacum TaxID=745377 RepID=A0A2Z2HN66_9EURY|nr:hypothetical protein B1756_00015 [Natrarchaeobaculum aegyptiacum]
MTRTGRESTPSTGGSGSGRGYSVSRSRERPPSIVTTATIHTLIADSSGDQVCTDVQWLL